MAEKPDTSVGEEVLEAWRKNHGNWSTEGEGHFPLSRKDPKPVVDFILKHQK